MFSEHSSEITVNPPKSDDTGRHDRMIPVLTERAAVDSVGAADADFDALVERVLDDIAPALHAAIATTCEDYLATHTARPE